MGARLRAAPATALVAIAVVGVALRLERRPPRAGGAAAAQRVTESDAGSWRAGAGRAVGGGAGAGAGIGAPPYPEDAGHRGAELEADGATAPPAHAAHMI